MGPSPKFSLGVPVFGPCDQRRQLLFPVVSQIWSSILCCRYIDLSVAALTEMKFIGKRLSVTPASSVGSGPRFARFAQLPLSEDQVVCLGRDQIAGSAPASMKLWEHAERALLGPAGRWRPPPCAAPRRRAPQRRLPWSPLRRAPDAATRPRPCDPAACPRIICRSRLRHAPSPAVHYTSRIRVR
jgi:hypothetical protein